MSYIYLTLIVPDALVHQAREMCETLAGAPGSGMFPAALSPTGDEPPTHWCSSGAVDAEFADVLSSATAMHVACGASGLPLPLADCQALLSASVVQSLDAESAHETFARLGLRLVIVDEPLA